MAMRFSNGPEQEKCEDCGCQGTSEALAYQVVVTKHLCINCADKRASKILLRDDPCQDAASIGKTLSLKCSHCTVGVCSECEIVVLRELEKLSLRDSKPLKDIKEKSSLSIVKKIVLPEYIKHPRMRCTTKNNEVVVVDADSGSLHLINLDSGKVVKIVPNSPTVAVSDCTTANRKELMFSNLASGYLTLCNMSGKPLADILLLGQKPMKEVFLGTNADGKVLAARRGESSFFLVDALTEKTVGVVSLKGKTISRGIQAASSNKVIVGSEWAEFVVVGVDGEQTTISDRNWYQAECAVHPADDLLYVLYSRTGADPHTVHLDEITMLGEIKRRSFLSFRMNGPLSRPLITPRMELLVCDGRTIFVYE